MERINGPIGNHSKNSTSLLCPMDTNCISYDGFTFIFLDKSNYTCRLRDLDLLPIKYFFILNDLIIFHKSFHDCYFI